MEFTKVKFILVAAWEAKGSARVAGPNLRFTSLVKLIERGGTSVFPLASLMFTILLSFCAAAFLFPLVRTLWQRWRLLPGLSVPPAASWIWGHEKDVFEAETGTKYTAWANELGPTYKIRSAWLVGVVSFDCRYINSELTCDSSTRTLWLQQTQGRSITSSQRIHTTTTTHLCSDL